MSVFFFQKGVHMTEADATKISKQMNSDIGLNKRKDRNTWYYGYSQCYKFK